MNLSNDSYTNKHMSFFSYTKAALVADSLSLATHWIYNQSKLKREFPDGVTSLHAPSSHYHVNKGAGDLTHYGDQTVWFAELLGGQSYNQSAWKACWLEKMKSYEGYVDIASQETIASGGNGKSGSNDLAGAARIAPLFDAHLTIEELIEAARSQTLLTHGDEEVSDAAEFFVRAVSLVQEGKDFSSAIKEASTLGEYRNLPVAEHIEKASKADKDDYLAESSKFGLTCHNPEAFPLVLYFLIHHGENFADAISKNAMAGGDTSARSMIMALFFVARDGDVGDELFGELNIDNEAGNASTPTCPKKLKSFSAGSHQVNIESENGNLSGALEYPEGEIKAVALFAHCFTCGKDFFPAVRVSKALAALGIATLRVDFSGIGKSDGSFASTSFLTNLDNLHTASEWLDEHIACPALLIGHSLGGAAVYAVAGSLCDETAVVSIGAPADPAHVLHLIEDYLEEIESKGEAEVSLAGRSFVIGKKFIDDLKTYDHQTKLKTLVGHKLVMHAPTDTTVELSNAGEIYSLLQHPKSFISLPGADHLLTDKEDAEYVANVIAVWAQKALRE